jgi:lipopolysaccharide biosynthesis glycosyltransferase
LAPDLKLIKTLPVSGWVSHSTYLRIWLAELLHVEKAIYLDADMVVVRNLEHLWSEPLDGAICAAVQDTYVPMLDPPAHWKLLPHLTDEEPKPTGNFRELGLNPSAKYFNAGMMVADLARWRRENVADAALRCLRDNEKDVRYWDQYALNVLFSERWKLLDHRWNQHPAIWDMPTWENTHLSENEFTTLRHDPWIVHFAYKPKPWQLDCRHPLAELYFTNLKGTPWRWFRPHLPLRERMAIAYEQYRVWRRQRVAPVLRDLKARIGLKRPTKRVA